MKEKHKSHSIRNLMYVIVSIITSLAYVFFWYSFVSHDISYRNSILIISAMIIGLSIIFGIILPLSKLFKKR